MTTWGQMQVSRAWNLFKSMDIFSDSANTFAMYGYDLETNNQAAWRAYVVLVAQTLKQSLQQNSW